MRAIRISLTIALCCAISYAAGLGCGYVWGIREGILIVVNTPVIQKVAVKEDTKEGIARAMRRK